MEAQDADGGSGIAGTAAKIGIIAGVTAARGVAKVYHHATKDGHLAAAGRQGIDELGQALKAFPDAVQAQEAGTIFNPTQGEVAAARRESMYGHGRTAATPSEIARMNRASHDLHGKEQETRSPSEIAADRGAEQEQGQERAPGRELER